MPIERLKNSPLGRRAILESLILLICAPFLLFPTVNSAGTILALLLLLASWLWPVDRHQWLPRTPLNTLWLVWWLWVGIAILVTADPALTLPKVTGLILGFAAWRFLSLFLRDLVWFNAAIAVFVLIGLGFTFIAILSVNWFDKIPFVTGLMRWLPDRFISLPESHPLGTHANQMAGTLLSFMLLPLSLLIDKFPPQKWGHWWRLFLLTLFLAALLLFTQSRSGWIGAYGGVVVLLVLWRLALPAGKKRQVMGWGLLLTLLALGLVLAFVGPERLQTLWEDPAQPTMIGSLATINFRLEVWRWGLAAAGDFPFTGMGLGAFRQVVFRLYPIAVPPNLDIAHAHNIFLQVALDVGLPGLVVYLGFLLLAGVTTWQIMRQRADLRPAAIGLFSSIVALHFFGLTDAIALGAKPGLLFWLALGLLTSMHLEMEQRDHHGKFATAS